MAITVNLSNITVALPTAIATLTDGSTYTSPTRGNVGVFVAVYKVDFAGGKSVITVTPGSVDPAAVTSWTFPYGGSDGWYQVWYVAAPTWTAVAFSQYDAVYYAPNKSLYTANLATVGGDVPGVSAKWTLQSTPTSIISNIGTAQQSHNLDANTTGTTSIANSVLKAQGTKSFGDMAVALSLEDYTDGKRNADVLKAELMFIALWAIDYASSRQDYSNGEKIARREVGLVNIVGL